MSEIATYIYLAVSIPLTFVLIALVETHAKKEYMRKCKKTR